MTSLYSVSGDGRAQLKLHSGQQQVWDSRVRFTFMVAGTQSGKTAFGPWWLFREIQKRGAGDYLACTSSYDLFKLKMLPELRTVFEHVLGIGRYWGGDKVIELKDPETGFFHAEQSTDPMWGRIILRSAQSLSGLESATAKAAWLDEVGQDDFSLAAWEAIRRRLSLHQGPVLGTTTPYSMGWLYQQIYLRAARGHPDYNVIQFSSAVNPAFPDEEMESAREALPDWKWRMFYLGEFERPAGLIYADFIDDYRENGGHKVEPFGIPREWPRYVGVDPGAVNQAKIWLAHDTDHDVYYLYREQFGGGKSTDEHVKEALALADENGERVVTWYVGAKSETQQRMDWKAAFVALERETPQGERRSHHVAGPKVNDVEAGIDRVIKMLKQHRLFVFDDCSGILDELATYRRKLDADGNPTPAILNKERYHRLDGLRCVGCSVMEPRGFYILEPLKK
jgi:hypothetical protein